MASADSSRTREASPACAVSNMMIYSTEAGRNSMNVGRDELLFHKVRILSNGTVTFFKHLLVGCIDLP